MPLLNATPPGFGIGGTVQEFVEGDERRPGRAGRERAVHTSSERVEVEVQHVLAALPSRKRTLTALPTASG